MDYIDDRIQNSNIIIYTTEDGLSKIETTFDGDTVWLSIEQMAELFQRDKSTISRHIKNIYSEELVQEATVAYFATVQNEGHRQVVRCWMTNVWKTWEATEVIYTRADAEKEFMGLTTFA